MSSWYRQLDAGLWGNSKFRSLSAAPPNAQTLWIYLLTGEHTQGMPGLYNVGVAAIAEVLEWPLEGLRQAITELTERGMIRVDERARVVYLPNALKHQPPQNPKHLQGWGKEYRRIPDCELKCLWLKSLTAFAHDRDGSWIEALEAGFSVAGDTVPAEARDTVPGKAADTVSDTVCHTVSPPNPQSNPQSNPHSRSGSGKPDDAGASDEAVPYAEIITYLNKAARKRYRNGSEATRRHIRARWREGFRLEDFKAVIDGQCKQWLGTDMERYLRPETLFGAKFESYLNSRSKMQQGSSYQDLDARDKEQSHASA